MVDPATLLATALETGAATGVRETATVAAKDTCGNLKQLTAVPHARHLPCELVLTEHEKHHEGWQASLAQAVTDSGVAIQQAVIQAAGRLITLLDDVGTWAGKYTVDLRCTRGVQVGKCNRQANSFTTPPPSL